MVEWKESVKKNVLHCGSGSSFGLCDVFVLEEQKECKISERDE